MRPFYSFGQNFISHGSNVDQSNKLEDKMTNLQIDAPKGPNLFARNCLYLIKCSSLISLVFTEVYTVCPKVFIEAHTVRTPQPSNSNINYLVCVSENYLFGKTKFDLSLQFAVL